MPEEQLETFRSLRDFSSSKSPSTAPESRDDEEMGSSSVHVHEVLDGSTRLEMSHAGGEFLAALQEGIEEEVSQMSSTKKYFVFFMKSHRTDPLLQKKISSRLSRTR